MSAERLVILAVDDERAQLEDLARILRGSPHVEDVECADNVHEALASATAARFDAIFLDVRMPDLDGLELARVVRRFRAPPQLVFVSAYDTAAVDAFELHAVDYLRKPVSRVRAYEAIDRIVAALHAGPPEFVDQPPVGFANPASERNIIAVAGAPNGAIKLIARDAVLYAQSHGDFVRIVTEDGLYLLRNTLTEIQSRWAPFGFVRVHRQYVANLPRAVELRPRLGGTAELVFAGGQSIPIARRHVLELSRQLAV